MRKLTGREKRLLVLLAIAVGIVAWDYIPRRWAPRVTLETAHYRLRSSATAAQTREIGQVAEITYAGYQQLLRDLQRTPLPHRKLGIKLFKDREEFRRCNRIRDWAEGFYYPPYCYQYYSAEEQNPYHWTVHEATHQLNSEVAGLRLSQWLDEGLACYVNTSRIVDDALRLGDIDTNTYPVWWVGLVQPSGDLAADKKEGRIIPLRAILSGRDGPDLDEEFNLYYVHWWSLVRFLVQYQNGKYRAGLSRVMAEGGTLMAFEKHIGPVDTVESEWYADLPELLKQSLRATPPVRLKMVTETP